MRRREGWGRKEGQLVKQREEEWVKGERGYERGMYREKERRQRDRECEDRQQIKALNVKGWPNV